MMRIPKQSVGGKPPHDGCSVEVFVNRLNSLLGALRIAMGGSQTSDLGAPGLPALGKMGDYGASITSNCDTLPQKGQRPESRRAVDIELDVRDWVKNVLVPALVDEFIKQNGKVSG
jgi:hypothetical protein